jgi:flavin reductase (DIM6/NTAB) family NADH-FMN oxidoreductase RutF
VSALVFDDDPDGNQRRRLLWSMPTGIYVVGTTGGAPGAFNLMTQSLAVQVATEPCVLALAIDVTAVTHANVLATGVATLSILRRDQRDLVRRFVKPVGEIELDAEGRPRTMAGVDVLVAASGAPYLADAAGCLDLCVIDRVGYASHTLFCCEVRGAAVSAEVLEGPASAHHAAILRMEDTKMNYGG